VTGVRNTAEPVVTYDGRDGPGEDAADLVIGADGIDSRVRIALFPQHPTPAYAGYITWRGLVPADAAPAASRTVGVTETWGRGQRFGIVPLADGQVYWFATASLPARSHTRDTIRDLAARYHDWHDPIPALLEATPPEALLRHDIYHRATPLSHYHAGRVVLLGDAAHALTPDIGQGGCLALEDAVTLTDLAPSDVDVPEALAAYESARKARTQSLVRISAGSGRIAEWRNPIAVTLRNAVASLIPASAFLRLSDETLGWKPPPARLTLQAEATANR
jgi:2-polyprenyl-6-methoxyphenol hydroxylase-like FAD-dependent oxidoreductase